MRKPPPKTIWVIWEVFDGVEYYWGWFETRAEARRYWKNHHPDLKFVTRKYVLEEKVTKKPRVWWRGVK